MMPQWTSAHLMFCEGPHDAAFVNLLLKRMAGFTQQSLKLSDLPYPLANVLKQSFQTRAAEDLRLDLAKRFFLPEYVLARESTLILVFSYGGSSRKESMQPFLDAVFTLLASTVFSSLEQPASMPQYAYAIFADADARGEASTRKLISDDFAKVGETDWLSNAWERIDATAAAFQITNFGPAATYVWRKSKEDAGTLEDLVLECLEGDTNLLNTLQYLDKRFGWPVTDMTSAEKICAHSAKRLKAAFSVEGQQQKPGGSLAVILGQSNLLGPETLSRSAAVQDCLTFLNKWLQPEPAAIGSAA